MVYHSENPQACIRSPFYAFSLYAAIRTNASAVYNESRLYKNGKLWQVSCPNFFFRSETLTLKAGDILNLSCRDKIYETVSKVRVGLHVKNSEVHFE
jgi:hypothetical protein